MTDPTVLSAQAAAAAGQVNEKRQWQRLMEMARFGHIPNNGVNRAAFSAEDIGARARLLEWADEISLPVRVDDIGNLWLRLPGANDELPPVVTGSHMDSQPLGGRFDGIYGVIAGLEALQAIRETGARHSRPIDVVAWSNEEGGRFSPGAMGSAVFTGAMQLDDCLGVTDSDGIRLSDALQATLDATPDLPRRAFGVPLHAYVEAHIEQGPVLERLGLPVGIVDSVQGSRWFEVTVNGNSAHAGTTPLLDRRDALRAAVNAVSALQALMDDPNDTVRFTVGRLDVTPNSPNTVPERVVFSIDFRHPDHAELTRRGDRIAEIVEASAAPCGVEVMETFTRSPCAFDPALLMRLEAYATALGLPHCSLPSGAFHDAVFVAAHCPTAMVFVPCEGGISHNPAENAKPGDLAAGTRLLTATLLDLANS